MTALRAPAVAACVLGLAVWCAPAEAGWRMYGRDLANSRDAGTAGPSPAAAASLAEQWRFAADDGDFTGTPVIAHKTVVVGSSKGSVYALDANTGELKWSHDFDEYINGSAAIAGSRVYVPLATVGKPSLVSLSLHSGHVRWQRQLDGQDGSDVFSSPVVADGTVFIGVGAEFKETTDPEVSVRGNVVALDAKTGKLRWKTYTVPGGADGGAVWSTPAVDPRRHLLYVGTGNAYHEPATALTDSVVALDSRTGKVVDHFQATPNDVWNGTSNAGAGPDYDFGASPQFIQSPSGQKLIGEGQKSGIYWALDRKTLDPVWSTEIAGPPTTPFGGIIGGTAYDGERIYGPNSPGGQVWAMSAAGEAVWKSTEGGPLQFNPVTVANGVLYTTTMSGFLTAHDAASGDVLTKISLGAGALGGVAVYGGRVIAVTGTSGAPGVDSSGQGLVISFKPGEASG